MCQYNDTCPTTRHRPGTVCPVEVRARNREARQVRQLWGVVTVLAITAGTYGFWWFFIR